MGKVASFALKVVIVAGLVLLVSILAANWYIHFSQPSYQMYMYTIRIHNAPSYGGSPRAAFLFPLLMTDDETEIFPEEELQHKTFGDWKSVFVMTDHGKMIALQPIDRNFTDVTARFSMERVVEDGGITSDELYLSPPRNASGGASSSPRSGQCPPHFSTLVYVPEGIQRISERPLPLEIEIEVLVEGGLAGLEYLDDYRLYGSTMVAPDTRRNLNTSKDR